MSIVQACPAADPSVVQACPPPVSESGGSSVETLDLSACTLTDPNNHVYEVTDTQIVLAKTAATLTTLADYARFVSDFEIADGDVFYLEAYASDRDSGQKDTCLIGWSDDVSGKYAAAGHRATGAGIVDVVTIQAPAASTVTSNSIQDQVSWGFVVARNGSKVSVRMAPESWGGANTGTVQILSDHGADAVVTGTPALTVWWAINDAGGGQSTAIDYEFRVHRMRRIGG